MSLLSWRESTERILRDLWRNNPSAKLVILGVGNPDNGDDDAGPEVIRRLRKAGLPEERVLLVDGGPAPENFTGAIRRFAPDLVLIVDAAWMGLPIGSVELLTEDQLGGVGVSTHGMPLTMLAGFLREELGCQVVLLAIQPETTDWGVRIGEKIKRAAGKTARELAELYSKNISMCSPSASS